MTESDVNKHRIVILAPTGADAEVLRDTLSAEKLNPYVCDTMAEFCEGIRHGAGTAILAREALTPSNADLLNRMLADQPEWSDFPLLVMSWPQSDTESVWSVLGTGGSSVNATVLDRPARARTLCAAVRANLRSRDSQYRVAQELQRRREAEVALRRRTEELAVAYKEMESFSYSVSHDLRAPLRTLRNFSDILLEDYSDVLDSIGKDYLDRISKASQKMANLIDDMLRLSRISRQEMTTEELDLSAMAQKIAEDLRQTNPDRSVEVTIEESCRAYGDRQLMHIALTNLLGNAWKYSCKKDRARVEFGCRKDDDCPVFYIRDNGAGFPMDYADRLFVPFQRLHSDEEFPGTGIGLPIVQRVIARHGGKIWAESKVGEGAVFYFTMGG